MSSNGKSNGRFPAIPIRDEAVVDLPHLTLMRCEHCAGKEAMPQCSFYRIESHCGIEQQSRHYYEIHRLLKELPSYVDDPALYAAHECALTYHKVAFVEERILRDTAFLGNVTQTASKATSALRTRARELERLVHVLQSLGLLRRRDEGEDDEVNVEELTVHAKALIKDLMALGVNHEDLFPVIQKQIADP